MDVSESQEAHEGQMNSDQASAPETTPQETGPTAQDQATQAAEGLRGQIAALRQQVRDAQDTLRDHKRRQETRSFKR